MERTEIIQIIKTAQRPVAWFTKKGAIIFTPTQPLVCIPSIQPDFFTADSDFDSENILIVLGVDGLAATDPMWNGENIFRCNNPKCEAVHSTDQNVHDVLWQRASENRRIR